MTVRVTAFAAAPLAALLLGLALLTAQTDGIHRHSFAGRDPVLVRGDANVKAEEKAHAVSDQHFKSRPTSEHLQLTLDAATGDAAFVHYGYDTPPAPVSPALAASVWVKATRPGVQLRARVVLPKERDPARPEALLTFLVVGKSYEKARSWDKLTIENVPELLGKHLPAVRAKVGREVNTEGAYVDRLVLNVYTGPGPVDVWVDDLEIGPVRAAPAPAAAAPGVPTANPKAQPLPAPTPAGRLRQVEQRGGQLLVDGKEHFFRAIRHSGTPLHVLRAAGFDAVWLPADAPQALVDEAGREGWLVIPSAPPVELAQVKAGAADGLFDAFRRKFVTSDVLFWDLGGGLTDDQDWKVALGAKEVRGVDRRRPLGGDLWDGFQNYSQTLDVVGAHRWPLFTSLELSRYGDWLAQRRQLAGPRPVFWTWVQNHIPDGSPAAEGGAGPHAEQVRLLAYLAIASGARGLGFWSDRALADAKEGSERLHGVALLNTELDLLDRILTSSGTTGGKAAWLSTSHPHVKAAMIPGQKGLLVIPMWLGPGDQYVPGQGAVAGLTLTVPGVSDGHDPWLVTPAGVQNLANRTKRTTSGTEVRIDEFDTVAPIVFTDDLGPRGLVVEWQDHARRYGRHSARWAIDQARVTYEKVQEVHQKLARMGVTVTDGDKLLAKTHEYYGEAQKHYANELYDRAYQDATRALRPLRVLMRAHWQLATGTLDVPTASPHAVSFYTLPKHWELAKQVQAGRPAASRLPNGDFELGAAVPPAGVPVASLPGWAARTGSLEADRVQVAAGIVPSDKLEDVAPDRVLPKEQKGIFAPSRPIPLPDEAHRPTVELGKAVLKLEVRQTARTDASGKPFQYQMPLERTFLAVDSPPVRLPPGTLVRVSGWVKVAGGVGGTADGALLYDDAGGEPLGARVLSTNNKWQRFQLYRTVPASGQIGLTAALTGVGVAYYDDLRVEPILAGGDAAVQPAGYRGR
ncbi:MAG: hypothetical protein U0804_02840 [Gemmataceae bacterium]